MFDQFNYWEFILYRVRANLLIIIFYSLQFTRRWSAPLLTFLGSCFSLDHCVLKAIQLMRMLLSPPADNQNAEEDGDSAACKYAPLSTVTAVSAGGIRYHTVRWVLSLE